MGIGRLGLGFLASDCLNLDSRRGGHLDSYRLIHDPPDFGPLGFDHVDFGCQNSGGLSFDPLRFGYSGIGGLSLGRLRAHPLGVGYL